MLHDATVGSEVKSFSGSSDCRTEHLELLSPSFAHFLSLAHAAPLSEDEAFMARASQLVEDMLVNNSAYLQDAETVGLAFTELLQPMGEDVYRTHHEHTISTFCRIEDEDIKVSAPCLVFQADVNSGPTRGDKAVRPAIRACDEAWAEKHVSI